MKTVNAEVKKNQNENTVALLRRFTKRVKSSGVLRRVRKTRFKTRVESHYKRKVHALKTISKTKEIERLQKLGKLPS